MLLGGGENKECNTSVSTLSTVTLNEDYSEFVSKLISQKKETEKYVKVESVVRYGSKKRNCSYPIYM
jgi:hypothetical protein